MRARMKAAAKVGGVGVATVLAAAGIWAVAQAWAAHCGGNTGKSCTENIRETKHNLQANTDILSAGTTEVCVFCHTPHGGRTDVSGGGAPLWNRALPPQNGYTVYDSPNFDNVQSSTSTPGPKGVSLACLSCHDGTIAFDALINAPGSGGFNTTNRGAIPVGDPGARLDGLSFSGQGVDATESMKEGERASTTVGGGFEGGLNHLVGPDAATGMEPFPNLSRDLRDDHPISIRMPDGSVDPQFQDAKSNSTLVVGNIRPVQRSNYNLPADKRDWVRLYNTDATTTVDWVECASCHNPHTPRTSFLRLPSTPADLTAPGDGEVTPVSGASRNLNHEPNQGSLICLTCHQK